MLRLPFTFVVVVCTLLATGAASGQGVVRTQAPPLLQACMPDYLRFCRGVPPGRGRILLCLNARVNELTQPCFQALTLRGLASAGALRLCRADYERLCAQTAPGASRSLACMLDNYQALSPSCREALARQGLLDDEPDLREFRR